MHDCRVPQTQTHSSLLVGTDWLHGGVWGRGWFGVLLGLVFTATTFLPQIKNRPVPDFKTPYQRSANTCLHCVSMTDMAIIVYLCNHAGDRLGLYLSTRVLQKAPLLLLSATCSYSEGDASRKDGD
ncbi:hypothetical protein LZ32DRAFT_156745 [Colletotrichum eremochloae]|nr:hypothetical protein LZ32DRAFT_156745 [Colletotrichum eremochloae]